MEILVDEGQRHNRHHYLSSSVHIMSNGNCAQNKVISQQVRFDYRKLCHSASNPANNHSIDNYTRFRSSTNTNTNHINRQNSFLHNSINSSLDFPTYIPWQSLSTEVNGSLKNGAVRINKSNCIEWATPIKEINEKVPLISNGSDLDTFSEKGITKATNGGISWQVASFLLVNCALGAGILNYPQAYDKVGGVAIATGLQIVLMTILGLTMLILVYSSDLNGDNTYHDVILSMCGKRAQQLAAISILLTCYGICVTFLIIIGDQMEKIFSSLNVAEHWFSDRKNIIALLAICFIMPMCYFRRLDFLKYAGTLGVFSMLYVVFINIYQYFYLNCENIEIKTRPSNMSSLIAVIPVICFAYQTHEICIPVYASMKNRTVKNFTKTTTLTLAILFILYSMAGTFAYLTFGTNVNSDIMLMYDAKQPLVMLGAAALVIKMITTYPPMVFCGRGALDGLYAEYFNVSTIDFVKGEKKRRIIITTTWFISSLILAIYTPNIGVVIELLGSLASANVFIFPSVCLIMIAKKKWPKNTTIAKISLFLLAMFLIIFGFLIFLIVIYEVYYEIVNGKKIEVFNNVTVCRHN